MTRRPLTVVPDEPWNWERESQFTDFGNAALADDLDARLRAALEKP